MGGVERTLFHDGRLCGGCHQLDQPALVPGSALDTKRWPDGKLPIHSTYDEWKSGPLAKTPRGIGDHWNAIELPGFDYCVVENTLGKYGTRVECLTQVPVHAQDLVGT